MILESSDEEETTSLSSIKVKDIIELVLSEIKEIKKPGTMIYDDDEKMWKPYKTTAKEKKRLKELDDELRELHQQQERARDKYQSAIPSEPFQSCKGRRSDESSRDS